MLQTAKVLRGPTFTPTFVPPAASKSQKAVSAPPSGRGIDRTGDAKLWKLHDEFCREHSKMKKLDTPASDRGSLSNAKAADRRAHQRWEDQLNAVDAIAKKISRCRANTLDGMLMKMQMTAHLFDWVGKSFTAEAYTSHSDLWEGNPTHGRNEYAEHILIQSIRGDLLRMRARGGSR